VVFKRRDRRSPTRIVVELFWPKGGWGRAVNYIGLRLRRLPDPPARIARGVASGVFVCFTPFFGLHFIVAALVAWLIRGNIVAALLSTLVGNPLTFPLIAAMSIQIGERLLGTQTPVPLPQVLGTFSKAFGQLTRNFVALLTGGEAKWDRLDVFFEGVFLPYLVGGLAPGLVVAMIVFWAAKPVIAAYQRRRAGAVAALGKRRLKTDTAR